MAKKNPDRATPRPAGYARLVTRYALEAMPNWHRSTVSTNASQSREVKGGVVEETYPANYWPGDGVGDHLEFALKYDGVNLATLASLFEAMGEQDLLEYIQSKPTGKYARRLWFFYEFLTGKRLPLEDLSLGNYVDALDPTAYFATEPPRRVRRQRVNDNMLGDRRFCPIVRRTEVLRKYEAADLSGRCRAMASGYPAELLRRALGYLYVKETKSSFEIEHVRPSSKRTARFVALLQLAEREDFCQKDKLIELQNQIVDDRFRDHGYRKTQNYVGETRSPLEEKIHFAGPRPERVAELMEGLIAVNERLEMGNAPAVMHAAVIAYGFVFVHPFEDGNGRIHRFLVHNILARRGFTPEGVMFPVSAVMLKHPGDYAASLEAFSRRLMPLVHYTLDPDGRMTVHNDTARWYRYIDMTPQVEALFHFIERTIDVELAGELAFLVQYEQAKRAIQEIVDMPDQRIDLFIRLCRQNQGRLAARKRASLFDALADQEIQDMEKAVQAAFGDS